MAADAKQMNADADWRIHQLKEVFDVETRPSGAAWLNNIILYTVGF